MILLIGGPLDGKRYEARPDSPKIIFPTFRTTEEILAGAGGFGQAVYERMKFAGKGEAIEVLAFSELDADQVLALLVKKYPEPVDPFLLYDGSPMSTLCAQQTEELKRLRGLIDEAAKHIDGVTGASGRPESDSGELYQRLRGAL